MSTAGTITSATVSCFSKERNARLVGEQLPVLPFVARRSIVTHYMYMSSIYAPKCIFS